MLRAARSFANRAEHARADSCIVIVLSHGAYDALIGVDEEPLGLHSLLDCFNARNAPLLAGKPKLFFVQACRGGKTRLHTRSQSR